MPIIALLIAAILVAADQFLKVLVVDHLKPIGTIEIIPGWLNLTYVENPGAAFGILANQRWLFISLTAIIAVVIIGLLFVYREHTFCSYTASVLILAGGVGNIIDRIRLAYVIDYLHVTFFPPVFNFADCCVVVGTILLMLHVLVFAERNKRKSRYSYNYKRYRY